MSRKVIVLFVVGVLLVLAGIFIGRSSKEESSSKKESVEYKESTLKTSRINIPSSSTKTSTAEVVIARVLDGDTVETSLGERIRYLGINSPEKGEPFSSNATEANKLLVLNKKVRLEFDVGSKDRYGRTLAYIFAGDIFVNIEPV